MKKKFHVKADFSGLEWGHVYGFVFAENEEAAIKAAANGDVEWEAWDVYDSEVQDMSEFEVIGKESDEH